MMSPLTSGFHDELVKTARIKGIRKFVKRLRTSKDLRGAIGRSTALGAGTGALTAALGGDSVLRGAALGAAGGTVTGAAFPAWFSRSNMLAAGERRSLRRKLNL